MSCSSLVALNSDSSSSPPHNPPSLTSLPLQQPPQVVAAAVDAAAATRAAADAHHHHDGDNESPLQVVLTTLAITDGAGPPLSSTRRPPPKLNLINCDDIQIDTSDGHLANIEIETQDIVMSPLQPTRRRHRDHRSHTQRPSWAVSMYYKHFPQWLQQKRRLRTSSHGSDSSGGAARISTNNVDDIQTLTNKTVETDNDHLEHLYSSWRVRWATRLDVLLEVLWVLVLTLRGIFFELSLGSFASWVWVVQLFAHSTRLLSFGHRRILTVCTYGRVISFAHVLSWELLVFYEIAMANDAIGFTSFESHPRFGWRHRTAALKFISRTFVDGDLGRTLPLLVNVVVLARTPSVKDVTIGVFLSGKRTRRLFSYFSRIILPTVLTLAYILTCWLDASTFSSDIDFSLETCLPALVGCIAVAYFIEFLIATPHLLPVKVDSREESDMDHRATFTDLGDLALPRSTSRSSKSIKVAYQSYSDANSIRSNKKDGRFFGGLRRGGGGGNSSTVTWRTHGGSSSGGTFMNSSGGRGLQGPSFTR